MFSDALASLEELIVTDSLTHIPDICHGSHGYIRGEKICHVEKFQISMHDRCGEILHFSTCEEFSQFLPSIDVEKSQISPHLTCL